MPHGYARNTLGPEDLRLAGDVFEAALANVGESDLHPYAIRKTLAQTVMEQVFAGERDRATLHDEALKMLHVAEQSLEQNTTRFLPRSSNENALQSNFRQIGPAQGANQKPEACRQSAERNGRANSARD